MAMSLSQGEREMLRVRFTRKGILVTSRGEQLNNATARTNNDFAIYFRTTDRATEQIDEYDGCKEREFPERRSLVHGPVRLNIQNSCPRRSGHFNPARNSPL